MTSFMEFTRRRIEKKNREGREQSLCTSIVLWVDSGRGDYLRPKEVFGRFFSRLIEFGRHFWAGGGVAGCPLGSGSQYGRRSDHVTTTEDPRVSEGELLSPEILFICHVWEESACLPTMFGLAVASVYLICPQRDAFAVACEAARKEWNFAEFNLKRHFLVLLVSKHPWLEGRLNKPEESWMLHSTQFINSLNTPRSSY